MNERIACIDNKVQSLNFDYDHLKESIKLTQDLTQKLSEDSTKSLFQMDEYKKSFADLISGLQKDINTNSEARKAIEIKVIHSQFI